MCFKQTLYAQDYADVNLEEESQDYFCLMLHDKQKVMVCYSHSLPLV